MEDTEIEEPAKVFHWIGIKTDKGAEVAEQNRQLQKRLAQIIVPGMAWCTKGGGLDYPRHP